MVKPHSSVIRDYAKAIDFEPLLEGSESPQCAKLRKTCFESAWSITETRIQVRPTKGIGGSLAEHMQSILDEANEGTLTEVAAFVNRSKEAE